ncbi:dATP/dGTP pyrophosphohydrolase domain-containing protein, partial [Citrobacter freundii]|uniref:dATP/dGTP pyrophosphohydrolase domain-containing protein n=3 Tax=Citrobacter freundii complex TaxID=1344959 RepID=UPI0037C69E63
TGISDEQITQAMVEKLAVNKQRKWPEPKDGEPRLHIKEQPAPVVPDGYCIMPVALTAKNGAKWALSGEFSTAREVTCPECEGDGCSDCDGRGDWYEDQAIDWTTIKEIYRRAVEVCALPTGQTQDKIA